MTLTSSSAPVWSPRAASSPTFAVPYSRRSWASAESSNSLNLSRRCSPACRSPRWMWMREPKAMYPWLKRCARSASLGGQGARPCGQGPRPIVRGHSEGRSGPAGSAPNSDCQRDELAGDRRRYTSSPRRSGRPAWKSRSDCCTRGEPLTACRAPGQSPRRGAGGHGSWRRSRAARMRAFVLRACDRTSASPIVSAMSRAASIRSLATSISPEKYLKRPIWAASGEVGVGLVGGEDAVGLVHAGEGVAQPSEVPHAFRLPRRHAGSRMARPGDPEQLLRFGVVLGCTGSMAAAAIIPARSSSSARRMGSSASDAACANERSAVLLAPREAARSPACTAPRRRSIFLRRWRTRAPRRHRTGGRQ